MHAHPRPRRAVLGCLAGGLALAALGACDRGRPGSSAEFCAAVEEHHATLFAGIPATLDDVEGLLDTIRDIGNSAPLAIEADWAAYELLIETALTSDDEQEVRARAYATERSAVSIANWIGEHCRVAVTPATLVAHDDLATPDAPTPDDPSPSPPPIASPP